MLKWTRLTCVVLIVLLSAFALAGCNFIVGIWDPTVGTWTGGVGGTVLTLALNGDKTFSEVMVALSGSEFFLAGSYVYDSKAKVITMTVSTYSMNGTAQPLSTVPGISASNTIAVTCSISGSVMTMSGGNIPAGTYTLLKT
jgi:hypothetical protein